MLKEKYDNLDLVPFSLYGPGDYELHLVELGSLTSLMTDRPTIEPSNHEGSQGSCTFKKLNNMQNTNNKKADSKSSIILCWIILLPPC